jgi:hypothetical protein
MFDTPYTENMTSQVESELGSPTHGYSEGVDENGRVVTDTDGNSNSLIIQAAEYAINGGPSPAPTPTNIPVPSQSPTVAPTQSPTIEPTQTPTPVATSFSSHTIPEFPTQLVSITLLLSVIIVLSVIMILNKRKVWTIREDRNPTE